MFSVMTMKKDLFTYLNRGIKYSLIPYLSFIFLLTALGSWQAFTTHSTWHMGDWLINYQGGFVRRGLLGEVIYQLAQYTHVSPGFYVFLVQVLINGLFFFSSYRLLKRQPTLIPYLLLIFAPFLFSFQINSFDAVESQGGYFKESIYCCIIALVGLSAVSCTERTFERLFYGILFCYPLVILTHETFALFLPFLLTIYLIKINITAQRLFIIIGLLSGSAIVFVLCCVYSGNPTQVDLIAQSLASTYPVSTYGSIGWLRMPLDAAFERVLIQINHSDYFKNYSLIILLSLIAFVPISKQLKSIFNNKVSCCLLILSLLGTFLICIVAIDWGRFIRIILVSLFILSLVEGALHPQEIKYPTICSTSKSLFLLCIIFTLAYALLWRIPNCCNYRPPLSDFKTNNLTWSYKPYSQIIKNILETMNKV